jgi:hypothetical protein
VGGYEEGSYSWREMMDKEEDKEGKKREERGRECVSREGREREKMEGEWIWSEREETSWSRRIFERVESSVEKERASDRWELKREGE